MSDFLQSEAAVIIISLLLGAAGYALSVLTWKVAQSPKLAELKAAYPVFNLVIAIAQASLKNTKYGLAADAALMVLQGQGFSPSDSRKYAYSLLEGFSLDKYTGTNFDRLSPKQIEQGEEIARQLIPGFDGNSSAIVS